MKKIICLIILNLVFSVQAAIIYVDKIATGNNDGSSWVDAFTTITPAIAVSMNGDEIVVAQGIYQEGAALNITKNLTIKGGFPTGGGAQNIDLLETIIDGNNAHRVISSISSGGLIINLDGLTITRGYDLNFGGSGIYLSSFNLDNNLTISRCKIQQNVSLSKGGGVIIGNATLTIDKTVISGNSTFSLDPMSISGGGGIYIISSIVDIKDSEIISNTSGDDQILGETYGGGIYSEGSELTIINTLINNNLLQQDGSIIQGAGIWNSGGNVTILNSVIKANFIIGIHTDLENGSGIYSSQGTLKLINSNVIENFISGSLGEGGGIYIKGNQLLLNNAIVANNFALTNNEIHLANGATQVVNNSYIKGQNPLGNNNIDSTAVGFDPGFVSNTDFHLQSNSVLVDAGDDSLLPTDDFDLDNDGDFLELIPIDVEGHTRIQFNSVDIGAYELQPPEIFMNGFE